MGRLPSLARAGRALVALAAVATVVGALGAAAAAPASAPTNPKHFFWAPGQSPQGTVDSATNDIIYHGGNRR